MPIAIHKHQHAIGLGTLAGSFSASIMETIFIPNAGCSCWIIIDVENKLTLEVEQLYRLANFATFWGQAVAFDKLANLFSACLHLVILSSCDMPCPQP